MEFMSGSKSKNVIQALILTEGGQTIGFGHVARCIALRDALRKCGIAAILVVRGDASIKKQFGSHIDSMTNWLNNQSELQHLMANGHVVFVDSYLAPLHFYKTLSQRVPFVIYLDDYMRLPYPPGFILNGGAGAEKFRYSHKNHKCFLGLKYALVRSEFQGVPYKKVRRNIRDVLVTFGGIARPDFLEKIIALLTSHFPKWRFHVVVSPARPRPRLKHPQIRLYSGMLQTLRSLMERCDLAISGGGQTTNELSACGVPTVSIEFARNQRKNIRNWARLGYLRQVGPSHEVQTFHRLVRSLKAMSYADRCRRGRIGQKLVDGFGASRVATRIRDLFLDFQKMQKKDCKQVFQWANDPAIRAASFSCGKISWPEHCAWFNGKLKDPKSHFYKVLWMNNPVGQVRFDRYGNGAKISVSLCRQFRRKGLGASVIRLSAARLFDATRLSRIHAFIKTENAPSMKAFQRAGFDFQNTVRQCGKNAHHLVLRRP